MSKFKFTLQAAALVVFTLAFTSFAQAQATRTWVSGVGDDVNPCSRTAPCKTYAGAISKTATGGEINALDPGGYGTLTITKAITVDGGTGAGWGSTLAAGVTGFTINITTNLASDRVILRNLSINGNNNAGGFHGIRMLDGAELTVQNVDIFNFTGNGIDVSATQATKVSLRRVSVTNVAIGVRMSTTVGEVQGMVNDCSINNTTTAGIDAVANARIGVHDTTIVNAGTGVRTSGSGSIINADDIYVAYCATGVQSNNPGVAGRIRLSDSIITQNARGIDNTTLGGFIDSLQGNSVLGNTVDGVPFSSTTNKQ